MTAGEPWRARRIEGGNPLLVVVCLVIFVESMGYGLVVPILPLYAKTLHVGDFQLGLLFAVYAIAMLSAAIPIGSLSDRFGRKPFILFGMFAMAAAFVFYAMANSYWLLVIARALNGIAAAAPWSAGLAMIGESFEAENVGQRFGYAMAAAATGAIAGPLVGGILAQAGHRAPFLFVAVLCLVVGTVALFLREKPRARTEKAPHFLEKVRPVLANPTIRLACLVMLVTTMGLGILEPMLPLRLNSVFHMSSLGIGLVFAITMLCYGIASPLAGKASDRLGRKPPMMFGMLATAVVTPLLAVGNVVAVEYVMMGIVGFTFAFISTPTMPLIIESLPARRAGDEQSLYGTAFGVQNLSWSLGYAIGPLIGGAMVGTTGLLSALLLYSGLVLVLAAVVWKKLKIQVPAEVAARVVPRSVEDES